MPMQQGRFLLAFITAFIADQWTCRQRHVHARSGGKKAHRLASLLGDARGLVLVRGLDVLLTATGYVGGVQVNSVAANCSGYSDAFVPRWSPIRAALVLSCSPV